MEKSRCKEGRARSRCEKVRERLGCRKGRERYREHPPCGTIIGCVCPILSQGIANVELHCRRHAERYHGGVKELKGEVIGNLSA